jgi:hypothetical protein
LWYENALFKGYTRKLLDHKSWWPYHMVLHIWGAQDLRNQQSAHIRTCHYWFQGIHENYVLNSHSQTDDSGHDEQEYNLF